MHRRGKLARKKSGFNQQSYPVTIITVHLLTESWSTYGAIFTPSLNNSIGGKYFFFASEFPTVTVSLLRGREREKREKTYKE